MLPQGVLVEKYQVTIPWAVDAMYRCWSESPQYCETVPFRVCKYMHTYKQRQKPGSITLHFHKNHEMATVNSQPREGCVCVCMRTCVRDDHLLKKIPIICLL